MGEGRVRGLVVPGLVGSGGMWRPYRTLNDLLGLTWGDCPRLVYVVPLGQVDDGEGRVGRGATPYGVGVMFVGDPGVSLRATPGYSPVVPAGRGLVRAAEVS
jgi:hypothetical protein